MHEDLSITVSGRLGNAPAVGCGFDSRHWLHQFVLCKWRWGGTALQMVGGNSQSIEFGFGLDAIVRAGCGRLQLGFANWILQ